MCKKLIYFGRGNIVHIVFIADKDFFPYTQVAIETLLNNSKDPHRLTLWIIKTSKFQRTSEYSKWLRKKYGANVNFIEYDTTKYENFYLPFHITSSAIAKFDIPDLIPETVKKVLYLDGDVFIKGDLTDLFEIELQDNFLAATRDYNKLYAKNINLSAEQYFNSGVMLLNLEKMRRWKSREKAITFLNSEDNPRQTSDQDGFNEIARNKWLLLNDKWNYTLHNPDEQKTTLENAKIIHFTNYDKPWSIFYNGPLKEEYQSILKKYTSLNIKNLLNDNPTLIWTTSSGAKFITEALRDNDSCKTLTGYINTFRSGGNFMGKPVYSPEILSGEQSYNVIVGSTTYANEIMNMLKSMNYKATSYSRRVWKR